MSANANDLNKKWTKWIVTPFKTMSNPENTTLTFFDKIQLAAMRGGIACLRLLGYRGILFLSKILGFIAWHFIPSRRRYTVDSIKRHLNVDDKEARAIGKASFWNNICSFMEAALVHEFRLQNNPHLLPWNDLFDKLINEPRAVVATTAHIGSWELLAGILPDVKTDTPQAVIVRNQRNRAMNALIFSMRSSAGGEVVGHRHAAPVVTRILRQNGITAFLVDHNAIHDEATFMDFLGEQASVNIGPALLALRAKAVIYPIFLIRRKDYTYEIVCRQPLDTRTLEGSINERARQIVEFYNKAVEDIVREHPEQWMWMHKRWKTKPTEGRRLKF